MPWKEKVIVTMREEFVKECCHTKKQSRIVPGIWNKPTHR